MKGEDAEKFKAEAVMDLAKLALTDVAPEAEPGEPTFCLRCHVHVRTDPELDLSPMCNPCAQDACTSLARYVLATATVVEAAKRWAKYGRDDGDDEDDLLRAVRALNETP